jgi:RNA polymerase sigma-70 factor (ECF subfamily)
MERMLTTGHSRRPAVEADLADSLLIARVVRREEAALGTLYDRYSRLIYAIAFRISNDHNVAEEVTQDVFYAVWQSADNFHCDGNLVSWLMGIARHRAIDATRSRRFRARQRELTLLDTQSDQLSGDEPTERLVLRETIRSALGTLPLAQQQPLALAFYGGLTHTEIASQLGEPVGTIKSRMRMGMLKLRDMLQSAREEEPKTKNPEPPFEQKNKGTKAQRLNDCHNDVS